MEQTKLMKNKLMFLIIGMFLISLGSASLGTFELNKCVDIKTVLNATSVNLSSVSYPNSTIALTNQLMTKTAYTFNYNFCKTNETGTYIYDYFDNEGNTYVNSFDITPNGEDASIGKAVFYIGLLAVLLFFLGLNLCL